MVSGLSGSVPEWKTGTSSGAVLQSGQSQLCFSVRSAVQVRFIWPNFVPGRFLQWLQNDLCPSGCLLFYMNHRVKDGLGVSFTLLFVFFGVEFGDALADVSSIVLVLVAFTLWFLLTFQLGASISVMFLFLTGLARWLGFFGLLSVGCCLTLFIQVDLPRITNRLCLAVLHDNWLNFHICHLDGELGFLTSWAQRPFA